MLASLPSTIGVLRLAELKCEVGKTWGPARGMHHRRRFMILEALGRVNANWYPMGPWFHRMWCDGRLHLTPCRLDPRWEQIRAVDKDVQSSRLSKKKCFRFRWSKAWISKEVVATFAQSPSPRSHFCKYKACTGKQKPLSHHLSQALRSVWKCPWLWAAEVDESLSVTSSIDTDSPTNLTSCPCPYAVVLIEERRAKHLDHWKDRAHPRSETKVSLLLALVKLQNPINQDLLRQWTNQNNRNPPGRRQSLQPG